MKRKVIIGVSIVFILSLVAVGVWIFQRSTANQPQPGDDTTMTSDEDPQANNQNNESVETTPNPGEESYVAERSEADLNSYIVQNNPSLVNTGTNIPVFSIVSKTEPIDNWYVVTIRNNETDTSDAQIVIRDVNGVLTTVAGPGTGLHTQTNLPDAIRKELEKIK